MEFGEPIASSLPSLTAQSNGDDPFASAEMVQSQFFDAAFRGDLDVLRSLLVHEQISANAMDKRTGWSGMCMYIGATNLPSCYLQGDC
jgi:hypothetical protein